MKDGTAAGKEAVRWFAEKIMELDEELAGIENRLNEKCKEIPHAGNILEISGIGERILSGILAEMGDISRFDDAKELQKLSGLGLVSCSSGKHKGETRISHRGRKRLRYWLFQATQLGQRWHMERNINGSMPTIQCGRKIRSRRCSH